MEVKGKGQMEVFHLESAVDLGPFMPPHDDPGASLGEEGVQGFQSGEEEVWGSLRSMCTECLLSCTRVSPLETPGAREVCVGSVGLDGPVWGLGFRGLEVCVGSVGVYEPVNICVCLCSLPVLLLCRRVCLHRKTLWCACLSGHVTHTHARTHTHTHKRKHTHTRARDSLQNNTS
jgi:hypothetical protein